MSQPIGAAPDVDARIDVVNLAEIWAALKAKRRWIVLSALAAGGAALLYVNTATPSYKGEAKLLLERGDSAYTRPVADREAPSPQIDDQAVASQVQVLLSRDVAREVIRRLDLVGNPEFDPLAGGGGLAARIRAMIGLGGADAAAPPEERIFRAYYDHVLIYPVRGSRVVAIEFESRVPDLAARGANVIAEVYLEALEAAKKESVRSASAWLGANIDGLRERVTEAERKVEVFRAESGLLLGSNNATIATQQLADLNGQLAQARSARADTEAKAALIKDMLRNGRTFEIPDVANNDLIRRLIEQRVTLRAQLALEMRTLLPAHPRIKELNAQLADLEAQIRGAAERTVRTLENEARIAGSRVETLEAAVDAQKAIVARANGDDVQLRALEREAKAQRDQLEAYLARYRDAAARDSDNAVPPDARIVSRAIVPQLPSFPKKVPIVLMATLAAAVLSAGFVVAGALLFGSSGAPLAAEPRAAREGGGARRDEPAIDLAEPPLTAAPPGEGAPVAAPASAVPTAGSGRSFAFETLMARLVLSTPEGRGRRVLVTGVGRGARAALMSHELGIALAQKSRAILIDVDAGYEDDDRPGFTDLVAGEASFADVISRAPGSRLHYVPTGLLDGALLADEWEGLDIALSAFDQTYDWLVLALHDSADAMLLGLLAPRMDSVVIASEEAADEATLVAVYEAAKAAGAGDVVVARETAEQAVEVA